MPVNPRLPMVTQAPTETERMLPGQSGSEPTPAHELGHSELKTGFALWAQRASVLLFVFLCAVMGVLLIIVPWWPQWTDNHFLFGHPDLRSFASSGFVRGMCSGLGVLDVWIGFTQALHYHEEKHS